MAGTRAALGAVALAAIVVALVSGGSGTDPQAPRFLAIPGVGGAHSTVIVDSLGKVVGRGAADRVWWGAQHRPGLSAAVTAERWVERARPLGQGAPAWARQMYRRSLLVLRALTDRRSGAVIAGARQGWAYVWPRDAAAAALAFAAAGERVDARRVARFLLGLDLGAAARFYPDGTPVPARAAQGDAQGWVDAAARGAGLRERARRAVDWRGRVDYQEKNPDDYLGNAIASSRLPSGVTRRSPDRTPTRYTMPPAPTGAGQRLRARFAATGGTLARRAEDPDSGVDSAAAWAVRPFTRTALFGAARRSLDRLLARRGSRFGIVPSEDWQGDDPWTAPTAWTAWAYAALADADRRAARRAGAAHGRAVSLGLARRNRREALRLVDDLRRAATPLGLLPERVDARTGAPRSTTPLAWSHAFAILALRRLWP